MKKGITFFSLLLSIIFMNACGNVGETNQGAEPMPNQDIKIVIDAHSQELMAIPGVVGIYEGVLADDDSTSCITIMVAKLTPELKKALPDSLDSFPVKIEETGEINPF